MSLSNKEYFFRTVVEYMQGDVAILDEHHRYVYVNPYAVRDPVLREWIIGKTDHEYCLFRGLSMQLADNRRNNFIRAAETRELVEWEESLFDKEGNVRIFLRRIFPIFKSGQDRATYMIGHGLEITERRKAREDLENYKRFTEAILNSSPHPIYVKDKESRFLMANKAMAELFNTIPEAMVRKSNYDVHTLNDETAIVNNNDQWVISEKKPLRVEETMTRFDGQVVWYDTIKVPLVEADGTVNVLGISTEITGRKLKDDELRKRQQELNEAQEITKSGNWIRHLSTDMIEWSRGAFLIWELDPDGPTPSLQSIWDSIDPDDLQLVVSEIQCVIDAGEDREFIYSIYVPSGKKIIHSIARSIRDETGAVTGIFGSVIDITAQKHAEERLRFSEERLIEAQELANMGSWEIDLLPDFSIRWSAGNFKVWELDEAAGVPDSADFMMRVHEEDRKILEDRFGQLMTDGQDIEVRYRATTFKGNFKTILGKGKARFNHEGRVVKIYGTTVDITDQERTSQILQLNEERLIQAQNIAKMGSWQYDLLTGVVEWTKGTYRIVERDENDPALTLATFRTLIHPDDLERFDEAMLLVSNGEEQLVEFRMQIGDKPLKYLEARGRGIPGSNGRIHKLFGTLIDITERKKIETELVRARREAETSIKAKEEFLAKISHELRTPLNGILGMTRLMKKTNINPTQREYLDVLGSTASNLQVIINDILDFAKIEAGKLSLEEVSFDPSRIAENVIQLQMERAEEKDLLLRHMHTGPYTIPQVVGDPHRLSQILLNLLHNAIKFTNHGEVTLYHELVEEDERTARIRFSVRDTGIGIPSNMHQSIFESFTQLNHSGRENFAGVGLGLSISKSLTEKQGGSIWVESEVGSGSTFHFIIPYRKAVLPIDRMDSSSAEATVVGSLRLLLAEDNKVNQFLTESLLQEWGFSVDVAVNGREAVQMAGANEYDMILMDIQMPELSGLEATRLIRRFSDRRKSGVPIIALTANTSRQAHRQFLTEGMNDWLVKPFRDESLYRKIVSHLESRTGMSERVHTRKFPVRRKPQAETGLLYDLSFLSKNADENSIFLKRMLGIFIDTIPSIVQKMKVHFERGEMDEVSSLAHKIKPTLDGAGIMSLKETIRNLELYRERKRTRQQAEQDLNKLSEVIDLVTAEFRREIDQIT